MALKKKEVKPAENNVLDEEKYIDDLVSKVSAAQKILPPIRRSRLTKFLNASP